MHPKKLPVGIPAAVAGALLLCSPAGLGWAHDQENPSTQQVNGSVPEGSATPEVTSQAEATVIERTLGEGPAESIVVSQGMTVRLVLHAPAGIQLHLHGYDLAGTATEASPVILTLQADHPGRYPIEAHGLEDLLGRTDKALAYLEVRPE